LQIPQHLSRTLREALQQHGFHEELIQRPDGWALWITSELQPSADEQVEVTRRLFHALLQLEHQHKGFQFHGGIGRSYLGKNAIPQTLTEAKHACLLAQTSTETTAVEHIDAMNVKGLIASWYNSDPVRETAQQLLDPLLRNDPTGDLVRT